MPVFFFSDAGMIVLSFFRVVVLAFVLYFLACVFYLIQRLGVLPSWHVLWKTMRVGLAGAPRITAHRLRIAPTRVKDVLRHRGKKHVIHPAYPSENKSPIKKSKKKK